MVDFDTIVLGLGCAGAATCSELSRRGHDVLGLEQHTIVNEYGSSHGDFRLFRFAYQEGSGYVPFLYESADRWDELESYADGSIFEAIGSATIGYESSEKLSDARETCEDADIDYEMFSGGEFSAEYPMWSLPEDLKVLYQADGGLLHSREGVQALIAEAEDSGALIRTQTEVEGWESDYDGVRVTVGGDEVVTAENLVVTTGPWASKVDELRDLLTVERHIVGFFSYDLDEFTSPNAPVWIFDGGEEDRLYGSPAVEGEVKLGNLDGDTPTTIDAFTRDWELYELLPEVQFSRSHFSSQPSSVRGEVCPITHSPDGDFIIDSSVEYENVYYGVGLSGHGLKLSPAIGRLMADCVVEGETEEMFSLERF